MDQNAQGHAEDDETQMVELIELRPDHYRLMMERLLGRLRHQYGVSLKSSDADDLLMAILEPLGMRTPVPRLREYTTCPMVVATSEGWIQCALSPRHESAHVSRCHFWTALNPNSYLAH